MRIVSERNIGKISFLYTIIVIGVVTFASGALIIGNRIDSLKKDLVQIEEDFFNEKERTLKNDVESVIRWIDLRRMREERVSQDSLEKRAGEAYIIAENLYNCTYGTVSEEKNRKIIREAIRPIRFNDNQGYFFIFKMDGEAILYPPDPAIEGTNFITNNVGGGPEIVENLIKIAVEDGAGFYRYKWTKPGDSSGQLFDKLSYVSFFEPLGWIIGTGDYIDELNSLVKRNTIKSLVEMTADTTVSDYYFFYELHKLEGGKDFATMIINQNRPDLVGKKISDDYLDSRGKPFRKEFMKGIRESGEAAVTYWYKKPGDKGEGRKLSYFKFYPEWNWVVARGIYLDNLDDIIAQKKEELNNAVKKDVYLLCIFFIISVTIALFIAYRFSRGLQEIFDRYRNTQEEHLGELGKLNAVLEKKSNTDALTGLYNRRYFNVQLELEISRATRYQTPLSLVLFDIDHFKDINDTHGHIAGDQVLAELAQVLKDSIRQSDILTRWGGEEFVVLAPGIELTDACKFAENLRSIVENHSFSVEAKVTCSFGVTSYRDAEHSDDFLQRADKALYQAKVEGRNRSVCL